MTFDSKREPSGAPHAPVDSAGVTTIVELLERRAAASPERLAYRFLVDGDVDGEILEWRYADLARELRRVGAALQRRDLRGERVLLVYLPGLDFVAAFFGCLAAGAVPVPVYPPDPMRLSRTLPRLQKIVVDAGAKALLTIEPLRQMAEAFGEMAPELSALDWICSDTLPAAGEDFTPAPASDDDLALLQYTSGSTGAPKGVMVSHRNLLWNLRTMQAGADADQQTDFCGWLPTYHDFGLIGQLMLPIWLGASCTLLSPIAFLQRPMRWLEALSRFGAPLSGAPNFAYDLCVRKSTPEQVHALDLSRWRVALNGAEPIRKDTVRRFADTFASAGFRPEALSEAYGLAESTLVVAGGSYREPMESLRLRRGGLTQGRIELAPPGDATAQEIMSCGRPLLDVRLEIVDPETRECLGPGRVGEIWAQSPSIAGGYWQRPELSAEVFGAELKDGGQGRFLRTGDLGFLHEGRLYLTGRRKDLIIIRGENHYPDDIELSATRAHARIRPGCVAAFAFEDAGQERLGIVAEVDPRKGPIDGEAIFDALRGAVADVHGIQLHTLALIPAGAIPKTSSGKIMRRASREALLANTLEILERFEIAESAPESQSSAQPWPPQLEALPVTERCTAAASLIAAELRELLELETDAAVDPRRPFGELGLDSASAVELAARVQERSGIELPATSSFDFPNVSALADWLVDALKLATPEAPVSTPTQDPDALLAALDADLDAIEALD